MKDQNYESADLKWSMLLYPLSSLDNNRVHFFPPVYTADFPLLSRNVVRYVILGAMNDLSLLLFENAFM